MLSRVARRATGLAGALGVARSRPPLGLFAVALAAGGGAQSGALWTAPPSPAAAFAAAAHGPRVGSGLSPLVPQGRGFSAKKKDEDLEDDFKVRGSVVSRGTFRTSCSCSPLLLRFRCPRVPLPRPLPPETHRGLIPPLRHPGLVTLDRFYSSALLACGRGSPPSEGPPLRSPPLPPSLPSSTEWPPPLLLLVFMRPQWLSTWTAGDLLSPLPLGVIAVTAPPASGGSACFAPLALPLFVDPGSAPPPSVLPLSARHPRRAQGRERLHHQGRRLREGGPA